MADLLDQLHANAGLNFLIADPGLVVFDGKVPDPTPNPPYLLAYITVSWPARETGAANALDGLSVTITTELNLHCVGLSAAAARAVAMRARVALLNKRPTIAGRNCGLIVQEDVQPPQRDETTGRLVMDQVLIFSFTSVPG